jgi:S-adenosylmethionine:tRNA ribosyltransferase-isomerase
MSQATLTQRPPLHAPPEAHGRPRDDVALLVARRGSGELAHGRFGELWRYVAPGDLLVVNTSATLPAALPGRVGALAVVLHLSTPVGDDDWIVELRTSDRARFGPPPIGAVVELPAGASAHLLAPYGGGRRLCRARLSLPEPLDDYLRHHGRPIRYQHADEAWPIDAYQTVFALDPGSAEMPSAGRAFTPELVTRLVAAGIDVAPVLLHAGVSSLEAGEAPHPEWFRVPRFTAERIELVRRLGGRVIAVGTTVVRALESAVEATEGWTDLVIEPDTPIDALDGLLTGFHDGDSSHLAMLEAIGGRDLVERSYAEAANAGYLRHEFGDLHLILP